MRIGDQSSLPQPTATPQPAPVKAAPTPTIGGDMFSPNPGAVNVVSYNVAGGASAFKLEEKLVDSQVFQKLVKGSPDAPIVACQETTPALAKKLKELSKNGNFEVIYPGQSWMPKFVPISPLMQGNMLLVPKRYKVESSESETFTGRAKNFFGAVKNLIFGDGKANDLVLALQNRGYVSARLKDTQTGKSFSVVNTHIAYKDEQRRQQTPQLLEVLKKAEAKGPVILTGDVNVEAPAPGRKLPADVQDFWKALEPIGLKDMGPTGAASASFWGNGHDIDVVMAKGFKSESGQMLTGDKMTIPGKTDAKQLSDHYAEADSLTFE